jgi:antitoxin YefM
MITSTKHQAIVGKDGKLEILTSGFPEGTAVEVIVLAEPVDETAYLLANETNRKVLLEAIDRVESRQDLVTFTPEEWNAQYNV